MHREKDFEKVVKHAAAVCPCPEKSAPSIALSSLHRRALLSASTEPTHRNTKLGKVSLI